MIATLIVLAIYAYGAWKASTAALSLFLLLLQIAEFAVRTLFGVLWYIPR